MTQQSYKEWHAELVDGMERAHEFLKTIHDDLHAAVFGLDYDLNHMVEFGSGYNQAVKDNLEKLENVRKRLAEFVYR